MRRSCRLPGAVLALCAIPGCVWVFQNHEPQPYTPNHEPDCTTTPVWWLLDGVSVSIDAGIAIAQRDDETMLLIGAAGIVLDLAGMVTGIVWAKECQAAHREYAARPDPGPPRPPYVVRRRAAGRTGHGWFCVGSPSSAGFCTRDPDTCAIARDAATESASDLGACRLTKTAWCFDLATGDVRCFPSQDGCTSTIARAGGTAGECQERR